MKFSPFPFLTLGITLVLTLSILEARGARGGERSAGISRSGAMNSGRSNGNRNYSRTPTMSRSEAAASRPSPTPSRANRTAEFARSRNFDRGQEDQRRRDFKANSDERNRREKLEANNARERINRRWTNHDHWFDGDFFDQHHHHPLYWNARFNGWRAATWAGVTGWLAWGWGYPLYYQEGHYPIETEATDLAQQQSDTEALKGDWYPLGVFAVGKTAELAANSFMFVQLAINKNGDIGGTYYNAATDQTHPISGSVDRSTQLSTWQIQDKPNSPTLSTGLYNLTRETTEVAVHFPDGSDQTWTLIRLEK